MASKREDLVTLAGDYLRQVATARLAPAGDPLNDERAWETENDLWVRMVRARNAFLSETVMAARDEQETSR